MAKVKWNLDKAGNFVREITDNPKLTDKERYHQIHQTLSNPKIDLDAEAEAFLGWQVRILLGKLR